MFTRQILHQLFKHVGGSPFSVTYWDGTSESFGSGPSLFTLHIRDDRILDYLAEDLEIGLGEAYMSGAFEVDGDLADVAALAIETMTVRRSAIPEALLRLSGRVDCRMGKRSQREQREDIEHHYDLGNDFFALWLDSSKCYSCAYFVNPGDSLEAAQQQKIDHSLRKLRLNPGESLLDIGSGWGALVIRASQNYGVRATGITLSTQQAEYSCSGISALSLQDAATVRLIDYQTLARQGARYDKIVSIGMIEHVGKAHLPDFFSAVASMLKPGGLALLHFITNPLQGSFSPWMDRYIFPGAYLPNLSEALGYLADNNFRVLDVENLRPHYQLTLDHWSNRFEQNAHQIQAMYGKEFVRMWLLYLRGCSASFRTGTVSVHQILVSNGVPANYPMTRADLYA